MTDTPETARLFDARRREEARAEKIGTWAADFLIGGLVCAASGALAVYLPFTFGALCGALLFAYVKRNVDHREPKP